MAESITTEATSTPTTGEDVHRVRLRIGSATLLLGGLIFLLGVSRPVITDWANAWDDKTAQLAIARADSGNFRFGMVTMGIGHAVMGIGAALLLVAMARVFSGRRVTAAYVGAALAIAGGLTVGLGRAIVALVDIDKSATDRGWVGIVGTAGLSLGFIACGVLTWRGPMPKWAGVVFAVAGLIAAPTPPAVFMFAAIAYGLLGIVYLRRGRDVTVS